MTPRYPWPIGTVVRGATCIGQPFEAAVVDYAGSLTPILSDGYATPASLIREVVKWPDGYAPPEPADDLLADVSFDGDALDLGEFEDEGEKA